MASGRTRLGSNAGLLVEAGPPEHGNKTAAVVAESVTKAREVAQNLARTRDASIENSGGHRATRDRDRHYPRSAPSETGRRGRHLPHPDDARLPLTAYQAKQLRRNSRASQDTMTKTQLRALGAITTDENTFVRLNTALSDQIDSGRPLSDGDRTLIQQADRGLRHAEQGNDRTHVVYVGLQPNQSLTAEEIRDLTDGDQITFDQFTLASHDPAETDPDGDAILLEIQTSRGVFFDNDQGTARHLLPRGLKISIRDTADADVIGPTGPVSRRIIVQAEENPDD